MRSAYKSNSNVRRTIHVKLTEPQFDALLTIAAIGEDHAEAVGIPRQTRETASRAVDLIAAAWTGEAA